MNNKLYYLISGFLFLTVIIASSFFTVDQRKYAVVFQFGEAVRTINKPGLNIKVPLIQTVEFFDNRLLNVTVEAQELTAADGKRLIVDAFVKYKIENPVTFFKKVYNVQGVKIRLNRILESSMRKVIGRVPLSTMLTHERTDVMRDIRDQVNIEAKDFGIAVVDVRILRADLPKENSAAIYSRMKTEREKEAKQIRAEGQEMAVFIRSKANKEEQILLAEAYKTAEIIKGEGDAEAAGIFNEAYAVDTDFYKFYRTLVAYRNSFKESDTRFVLSPNSEFFKYTNLGK